LGQASGNFVRHAVGQAALDVANGGAGRVVLLDLAQDAGAEAGVQVAGRSGAAGSEGAVETGAPGFDG
jgi:hypothetical protein